MAVLIFLVLVVFNSRLRAVLCALQSLWHVEKDSDALALSRARWMVAWTAIATVLIVGLIVTAYFENQTDSGEPFALMSGVSLWPTEFFRLFALLLAGYFLIDGHFRLVANEKRNRRRV